MRTSDETGRTATNKTSNTEHGDHQIFKYFTGPPMESAKGTTTESNNNQPKRKKESREGRRQEEGAVKKLSKRSVKMKACNALI